MTELLHESAARSADRALERAAGTRPRARGRWARVRAMAWQILHERSSPARLGWAVAVGVLIGTTPLYGFHLAMALAVGTVFRLNRTITYLAANVPSPAFAPLLGLGSVQLGTFALHGEFLPLTLEAARNLDPWDTGKAWLLGSVLLGAFLGIPFGVGTYAAVASYRRRNPLPPDPVIPHLEAAAERYRDQGRFARGYVKGKFEHDPVYRQLAERCPLAMPAVDLGCGRGQTGVLLALVQPGLRLDGVDWDEAKLASARRATGDLPGLTHERADVRAVDLAPGTAGTVLLIDVLHYHPIDEQDRLLARAAAALAPGGTLYVRDLDFEAGWRARITTALEHVGRWLRLNRGATLCFRPASALVAELERHGLAVTVHPSSEGLLFSNVLLEAHRTDRRP